MEYLGNDKPVNLMSPLVSVCVPTFNHAPFIKSCLESILNQQADFSYEILIGEDDSKDGTREICLKIAEENQDKIRLFLRNEEDKVHLFGRKSGRGNHLALYTNARGKYICICDGDDLWIDSQKINKQVAIMEKYPSASLCITNTILERNPEQSPPGIPDSFKVFSSSELYRIFYMGHISSWMIRNEMEKLLSNKIVEKAIALDQVLFSYYKNKGDVIYIPELTSKYRFNPNGVYLSQPQKKNKLAAFRYNWYLFKYLHRDLPLLVRTSIYSLKRYLLTMRSV